MKKVLLSITLLLSLLLISCEGENISCGNRPTAPYGTPDDTSTYRNGDYQSVTYTYYCKNGKYITVTWSKSGFDCWEKSEYTSSGICY